MSPAEAGYVSSEGTRPAASGTYSAGSKDPAQIQRDIAHTRAEMSETVDAIGARFDPDYLKEQAKDVVRSTARDARSTMIDTIKENPVPAILAGLSLGWLIAKGGDSTGHDRDRRDYEEHYFRIYGRYPDYRRAYTDLRTQGYPGADAYRGYGFGAYQTAGRAAHETNDLTDEARRKAQHAADQAGDLAHTAERKAEHLADRATDMAQEAGHQIQEVGHQMEYYGRQATNWLQDQVYRNPLGVGAAALAAGALVGMAVPETHAENRLMGEQAERVKSQARSAAQEKLDQAKDVASKVADEAADKAKDVAETAKSEARDVAETAKAEARKEGLNEPPKAVTGSSGSSSSGSPSGSAGGSAPGGSTSGSASSGGSTSGNPGSGGSLSGTSGSTSGGSASGTSGSGTPGGFTSGSTSGSSGAAASAKTAGTTDSGSTSR